MKMSIDESIGVIENLKSTMSVCIPEPEKTEICTSLSEIIDTLRKYEKIQKIVKNTQQYPFSTLLGSYGNAFIDIREVIEDGNDN